MRKTTGGRSFGNGFPASAANDVRLLANVLIRMPNHATPYEPAMPTRLHNKITATFKNGLLTVTLPKSVKAQQKVKRISINPK